jgi:DNA-binding response OmpR family regulator
MEISTIFYLNDDATGLARAMRATLATLGHYAVAEAETIDEALSLLRRELPGLIMIDLRGPDAALAACREIREYVGFARPIIVLSESNTERDRIAALDAVRMISSRGQSVSRSCWHGFGQQCAARRQLNPKRKSS